MRRFSINKDQSILAVFIIASALVTALRTPLLHGTFAGLIVTVLAQLYLPGWLLARVLGKHDHPNWIVRFAWVLASGLGLTVPLGAVARVLNLPVPVYLVGLHLLMAALVLAKKTSPPPSDNKQPASPISGFGYLTARQFTVGRLSLYGLVAVCCLVVFGVSYESRARFYGFEDQPIFISLIDWMVTHPETRPNDVPLRSRQIGVLNGDTRLDSDGWSYNHAAWVWASGVSAAQLIWYDLGALLVWVTPLLAFALAYELTGREWAAAWCAAALTLAGLVTADNIVYNPTYTAYGRFVVFQINTLRQMSIAIMLPLALLAGLNFLRTFNRSALIVTLLAGLAVASMHPTQTMTLVLALGVTVLLRWLAAPNLKNLRMLLPLAAILVLLLALPFVQRFNRVGLNSADSVVTQQRLAEDDDNIIGYDFLILRDVPLIGTTFIRNPAAVFYSPIIILTVIIGLLYALRWRTLTGAYLFGTTALALLLFFTPGLTALFNSIASSVGVLTTMFLLPVSLALGLGLDALIGFFAALPSRSVERGNGVLIHVVMAGVATALMGLLLYEPIPIRASTRDQLIAYNDMQAQRYLHSSQAALIEQLQAVIPDDAITVMLTPYAISNLVIEDVSGALITGGRLNRNVAYPGSTRFFNETPPFSPWLDAADAAFIERYGVTHIVVPADATRLPQLLLQPERFEQVAEAAGYRVFALLSGYQPDAADALFERMNDLYSTTANPRWSPEGFTLILPGDDQLWRPLADQWQALLAADASDERARLGLAFSLTMSGDDAAALEVWRELNQQQPAVFLYADAAATLQQLDPSADALVPLLEQLRGDDAGRRVLAARRLLSETFFYRLSPQLLDEIIAVTESDAVTWDGLANLGKPDAVRRRAGLLMNAGHYATARAWLATIPRVEWSPADMNTLAALRLAEGDLSGSLDLLKPATDQDWLAANRLVHPDRWENNTAAQTYYLLLGSIAAQEGRSDEAETAFEQAINAGAHVAGRYLLAEALAAVDAEKAQQLIDEASERWAQEHDTTLPALLSPLAISDNRSIAVMHPVIERSADEQFVRVSATYGDFRPRGGYTARTWRVQVISPDGATRYGEAEYPALFVAGVLSRVTIDVPLRGDIPPLTPALIYIQAVYNEAVTSSPLLVPVVLNRPDAASIPPDATAGNLRFGESVTLDAYTVQQSTDALDVTLYWQTDTPLPEDYQVFVHVLNAAGETVAQRDVTPLDNRYQTSQWRAGTVIEDSHRLALPQLSTGSYRVLVGLYRLPAGERLSVAPVDDERAGDGSALIAAWEIP